ncbi:MAG TPA: lipid-binding SYLF domain-containing protein [Candidatus Angelobacter sp.]|nr:lipid-binding SYLF domain-containing protein [Candidatus Angelobacter sp.]
MKIWKTLFVVAVLASVGSAETEKEKALKRLQAAAEVLESIAKAPDKGIPEEVLSHAKCIAVIPHEIKGGFIVGAVHGRGVATCRTTNGWSAPAYFAISGDSWGAQIGVAGIDNVLVFMNQEGMEKLLSSKFQIGGDLSAAAGPIGRHASAGVDWKMDTGILSYSRAKGIFAGATLNGAVITPDADAMEALYGVHITTREVLTGRVPPPASATLFLRTVARVAKKAAADSNS